MGEQRIYYARPGQQLRDHLHSVAELARRFAEDTRPGDTAFAETAYWAGLLHDLGKYSDAFRAMLSATTTGQPKRCVEHSGHGASLAAKHGALETAFAVAGHHAGLGDHGKLKKLLTRDENHSRDGDNLLRRAGECWMRAANEMPEFSEDLPSEIRTTDKDVLSVDLRTRMLFSCLIDADRLDAKRAEEAGSTDPQRVAFPSLNPVQRLEDLRAYVDTLKRTDSSVNLVRRQVLESCLSKGSLPQGLFSLTVPTGGGKTLASLAFALKHAMSHGLKRVVVVIPYLSIIEQNADVFRKALGNSVVLEHHSAVQEEKGDDESPDPLTIARREAAENWDAPVVVTTSVQFFESLFSNRPNACRKLHRIARSVVVMDEVQTFPKHLLSPILNMIQALSRDYGTSFVFCTATQPAFEKRRMPGFANDLKDERFEEGTITEIADRRQEHFQMLRRVRVEWPKKDVYLSWRDVAARMVEAGRALCVVNTKDQALSLFRKLQPDAPGFLFHLSTRMCPQHRMDVLKEVGEFLKQPKQCLLVSTQLVEAGVDLDFPLVMRALGPLDSIAQAAGRCNREDSLPEGEVVVFRPEDGGLPQGGGYKVAVQVTEGLLREGKGVLDIHDPTLYQRYFQHLYETGDRDAKNIQALRQELNFHEVAGSFRIIDPTFPVLVPYNDHAKKLINLVRSVGRVTFEWGRELQRYTIGLYEGEKLKALQGTISPISESGAYECLEGRYDPETGVQFGSTDPMRLVQA